MAQEPDGPNQPPPQPPHPPYPQFQPYGQYQPYPPYPPPRSGVDTYNGLAITSMVLGILRIYWIGSILALIFGYIAKSQIRERPQQGSGMATAGIVLGWVGVGTLALMIVFIIIGAATGGFDSSSAGP